jgi:hypothetical protein
MVATSFPLTIDSSGRATVTFADEVTFSISTGISASSIGRRDRSWHDYNVNRAAPTVLTTRPQTIFSPPRVYSVMKFELQDVWMGLRDYPALEYMDAETTFTAEFGNPVVTGSKTVVDLFGEVVHTVDSQKMVLVNATAPDHDLHEGYVLRHCYNGSGGRILLQTLGFGTGANPRTNEFGAEAIWGGTSLWSISIMASEYYARRTGRHAIYYESDPEFARIPIVFRSRGLASAYTIGGSDF